MSSSRLIKQLFKTKAFQVLDKPTILTSGEIGIYYVNTEKLCPNHKELLAAFGDIPEKMIEGSIRCYEEDEDFKYVIDTISNKAKSFLENYSPSQALAISGGQRRDWIFSGPVAYKLDLPHVTLYKPVEGVEDRIKAVLPDGKTISYSSLSMISAVHVADLMTKGSSAYTPIKGRTISQCSLDEKGNTIYGIEALGDGWIPMQRRAGITVDYMINVVTRLQGGEENMEHAGVFPFSFVAIDRGFITEANKADLLDGERSDIAHAYMDDPEYWGEQYIKNNGIDAFVNFFDPSGSKIDRASKFVDKYSSVLEESGKIKDLDNAVKDMYGKCLDCITGKKPCSKQ